MHLEKNILKGKFGQNKELKKEAREEIHEMKGKMAKKMKHHGKKPHHHLNKYSEIAGEVNTKHGYHTQEPMNEMGGNTGNKTKR